MQAVKLSGLRWIQSLESFLESAFYLDFLRPPVFDPKFLRVVTSNS